VADPFDDLKDKLRAGDQEADAKPVAPSAKYRLDYDKILSQPNTDALMQEWERQQAQLKPGLGAEANPAIRALQQVLSGEGAPPAKSYTPSLESFIPAPPTPRIEVAEPEAAVPAATAPPPQESARDDEYDAPRGAATELEAELATVLKPYNWREDYKYIDDSAANVHFFNDVSESDAYVFSSYGKEQRPTTLAEIRANAEAYQYAVEDVEVQRRAVTDIPLLRAKESEEGFYDWMENTFWLGAAKTFGHESLRDKHPEAADDLLVKRSAIIDFVDRLEASGHDPSEYVHWGWDPSGSTIGYKRRETKHMLAEKYRRNAERLLLRERRAANPTANLVYEDYVKIADKARDFADKAILSIDAAARGSGIPIIDVAPGATDEQLMQLNPISRIFQANWHQTNGIIEINDQLYEQHYGGASGGGTSGLHYLFTLTSMQFDPFAAGASQGVWEEQPGQPGVTRFTGPKLDSNAVAEFFAPNLADFTTITEREKELLTLIRSNPDEAAVEVTKFLENEAAPWIERDVPPGMAPFALSDRDRFANAVETWLKWSQGLPEFDTGLPFSWGGTPGSIAAYRRGEDLITQHDKLGAEAARKLTSYVSDDAWVLTNPFMTSVGRFLKAGPDWVIGESTGTDYLGYAMTGFAALAEIDAWAVGGVLGKGGELVVTTGRMGATKRATSLLDDIVDAALEGTEFSAEALRKTREQVQRDMGDLGDLKAQRARYEPDAVPADLQASIDAKEAALRSAQDTEDTIYRAMGSAYGDEVAPLADAVAQTRRDLTQKQEALAAAKRKKADESVVDAAKAELDAAKTRASAAEKELTKYWTATAPRKKDVQFQDVTGANLKSKLEHAEDSLATKYFYNDPRVQEVLSSAAAELRASVDKLRADVLDAEVAHVAARQRLKAVQDLGDTAPEGALKLAEKAENAARRKLANTRNKHDEAILKIEVYDVKVAVDTVVSLKGSWADLPPLTIGDDVIRGEDMRAALANAKTPQEISDALDTVKRALGTDAPFDSTLATGDLTKAQDALTTFMGNKTFKKSQTKIDDFRAKQRAHESKIAAHQRVIKDYEQRVFQADADFRWAVDAVRRTGVKAGESTDPAWWVLQKGLTTDAALQELYEKAAKAAANLKAVKAEYKRKVPAAKGQITRLKKTAPSPEDASALKVTHAKQLKALAKREAAVGKALRSLALRQALRYIDVRNSLLGGDITKLGGGKANKLSGGRITAVAPGKAANMLRQVLRTDEYITLNRARAAARQRAYGQIASAMAEHVARAKGAEFVSPEAKIIDTLAKAMTQAGRNVNNELLLSKKAWKEALEEVDPGGLIREKLPTSLQDALRLNSKDIAVADDVITLKATTERSVRGALDALFSTKAFPDAADEYILARDMWNARLRGSNNYIRMIGSTVGIGKTVDYAYAGNLVARTLRRFARASHVLKNPAMLGVVSSRMHSVAKAFQQRSAHLEDDLFKLHENIDWSKLEGPDSFYTQSDAYLRGVEPVESRWGNTLINNGDSSLMDSFAERAIHLDAYLDSAGSKALNETLVDIAPDFVTISRMHVQDTRAVDLNKLEVGGKPFAAYLARKVIAAVAKKAKENPAALDTKAISDIARSELISALKVAEESNVAVDVGKYMGASAAQDAMPDGRHLEYLTFAVAHGGLRRRVTDGLTHAHLGRFDEEAVAAAQQLLMRTAPLSPEALQKALRIFDDLEMDISAIMGATASPSKNSQQLENLLSDLMLLDASDAGRVFAPRTIFEEINKHFSGRIKSLDELQSKNMAQQLYDPVAQGLVSAAKKLYQTTVVSIVAGVLLPSLRRLYASMPTQNVSQIAAHTDFATAMRVTAQVSPHLFSWLVPYKVQKPIVNWTKATTDKIVNRSRSKAPPDSNLMPEGYVMQSLLNPNVSRIFNGESGVFKTLDGRTFTLDDIRRLIMDESILTGMLRGNLPAVVKSETRSGWYGRNVGSWFQWNENWIRHTVETAEVRWRVHLFMDLLNNGASVEAAAKKTKAALYDFSTPMGSYELSIFDRMVPFFNVRWNTHKDAVKTVLEPLLSRNDPSYYKKALTGSTKLGKVRRQYRVLQMMRRFGDKDPDTEGTQSGDFEKTGWNEFPRYPLDPEWAEPTRQLVAPRFMSAAASKEKSEEIFGPGTTKYVNQVTLVSPELPMLQGVDEVTTAWLNLAAFIVVSADRLGVGRTQQEERSVYLPTDAAAHGVMYALEDLAPIGAKEIMEEVMNAYNSETLETQRVTPGEEAFFEVMETAPVAGPVLYDLLTERGVDPETGEEHTKIKRTARPMLRLVPGVADLYRIAKSYAAAKGADNTAAENFAATVVQHGGFLRYYYAESEAERERKIKKQLAAYERVQRSLK
jgi:hypothetical protein